MGWLRELARIMTSPDDPNPPAPRDIYNDFLRIEPELSKLPIALDMMAKYEQNRDRLKRKQAAMFVALIFVGLESVALALGLVVQ